MNNVKPVFNWDNTEWKDGGKSLILGDSPALYDSINRQHDKLFQLYKWQKAADWSEDEINLSAALSDFDNCPKDIADGMIENIAYQWETDSMIANTMVPLLSPFITNSELATVVSKNAEIECITPDHEVLTPEGWKLISEVTWEDSVLQVDIDTQISNFIKPNTIVKKRHKGKIYSFKDDTGYTSQQVTPNHRMPFLSYNTKKTGYKLAEDMSYNSSTQMPISSLKTGCLKSLTWVDRFKICCQADGCVDKRCNGSVSGEIPVKFVFSKERKIEKFIEIMNHLDWNWKELKPTKQHGNVKAQRRFAVKVPLALSNNLKDFEWFSLENVSHTWAEDFIKDVGFWDGTVAGVNCSRLITTNRGVADKVQTLASICGYSTYRTHRVDDRSDNYSDCEIVSWKKLRSRAGSIKKDSFDYDGLVYCLTVDTGYFLVRHNGAISVTGNCLHSLTYSEIVKLAVPNPERVFERVMLNNQVKDRGDVVSERFERLKWYGAKYTLGEVPNDQKLYDEVFLGLVALFSLERLQFMSSFAHTFAIVEQDWFQGIGKLVQKIMQDEYYYHAPTIKYVLKHEMTTSRGMSTWANHMETIKELVDTVVDSEYSWNDHIFGICKIPNVSKDLMNKWSQYNAQDIYRSLMLEQPFVEVKDNPLLYMDKWLDLDKFQNANQEGDNNNYSLNSFVNDVSPAKIYEYY